jgi:hypothetical protein
LAIAFARAEFRVAAICPPGHPLRVTRAVERLFHYPFTGGPAALAKAIAASGATLVIPSDDRSVAHLQAIHEHGGVTAELAAVVRRSLGPPEAYAVLRRRHATLAFARQAGIRIPPMALLRCEGELQGWREPFPWVIKSSGSWGGAGVRIVRSRAEAIAAFRALARPLGAIRAIKRLLVNRDGFWIEPCLAREVPEVIIQGFIPGQPASTTVACWQGEVLSSLSVLALRTQGPTGASTLVRVIENPDMVEAARRFAGRLNLSGLFGLDFVIDDAGDPWMIELNPRATQLCHLAMDSGASLAEALARAFGGHKPRHLPPAREGTIVAVFPQAWRGDPSDPVLRSASHDVPWDEPRLVEDLMSPPWPNRGLLARAWQRAVDPRGGKDAWAGTAPVAYSARAPRGTAVPIGDDDRGGGVATPIGTRREGRAVSGT